MNTPVSLANTHKMSIGKRRPLIACVSAQRYSTMNTSEAFVLTGVRLQLDF